MNPGTASKSKSFIKLLALSLGLALAVLSGATHAADGTWVNASPQTATLTTTGGTTINYSGADPANDFVVGDAIRMSNTNIGLSNSTVYYVLSKSGSSITLATTPGGSAVTPTTTGSSVNYTRSFQWNTSVTGVWSGGTVASGTDATANFTTAVPSNIAYVTSATTLTIGNINFSNTGGNLQIASSTLNSGTLNFAVSSGTPTITNSGNTGNRQLVFLPANNTNEAGLKITGNQGLLFLGTGTNSNPHFLMNSGIDWTGFSGGYTVQEGVLQLGAAQNALSTTQSLTLGNGSTGVGKFAQLNFSSANNTDQTLAGLNGTSSGRVYVGTSGGVRTLTLGNGNGSGTFAGIIGTQDSATVSSTTQNLAITKNGTGTQTFSGANTYTGITTVNGGTLVGANAQAFGTGANAAGQITMSSGTATLSLLNDGSGNNGTIIYGGTSVSNNGYNVTTTSANLPTFNVGNNGSGNTGNTIQLGALTTNSTPTNTFTNANGYNLTFTGTTTTTGGATFANNMVNGTLNLAAFSTSAASTQTLTISGTSVSAVTQISSITSTTGTNVNLAMSGSGTLAITGSNSHTGTTTASGGTLKVGNLNALGATGITLNSGGTLDLNGNAITNAFTNNQTRGTLTNTGAAVDISATTITNNGAFTVSGTGDITLGSIVGGSITETGSNTVTLAGTVDNNGTTATVSSGTLVLNKPTGGAHAVGTSNGGTSLTVNGGTVKLGSSGGDQIFDNTRVAMNGGTFDLNGKNESVDSIISTGGTLTGSGTLTAIATFNAGVGLSGSSGTFTVNSGATFAGTAAITGGTVVVGGSLTGSTTVSGGILDGTGTVGAVTVTGSSGSFGTLTAGGNGIGTLTTGNLSLTGSATLSLQINGAAGTSDKINSGTLSLDANNSVVLSITDIGSGAFTGSELVLVDYTGSAPTGRFFYNNAVLNQGDLLSLNGNSYTFTYDDGNTAVALMAVPEPGTWAMVLGGLGILIGYRRSCRSFKV